MQASLTCDQVADEIMQAHDLAAKAPKSPEDFVGEFSDAVDAIVWTHVEKLSDQQRFAVWYSCSDSLDWGGGLDLSDNATKSALLGGLAMWAVYLTIKARLVSPQSAN